MVAFKYFAAIGMVVVAVVAFAAGLVAAPIIFPRAEEDPVWARITESGKMIVGTEPGWPPYEYTDDEGNIIGFEIDITERIAEMLDLEVEWRDMGFDAIIPSVQAMDIDLGVSGFSVTADRLETIDFTMPHSITEGQVIMLKSKAEAEGIAEFTSLENLTDYDLTCATQVGTTQEAELNDVAPSASVTYDDFLLALQAMQNGQVDSVYAETPITSNWILEAEQTATEDDDLVVVFRRPYYPVAFVVNKDADTFMAKINGALAEIIASGELDELRLKWKT
jgi:ABC-type amino acid transport substrate-binding protein